MTTTPPTTFSRLPGLDSLDPAASEPLFRQIYERFRRAIATQALRPGDRIPSVRALTRELGLAKGTVEAAYSLLAAEGYIQTRGQAGTIVTPDLRLPESAPSATPRRAEATLPGIVLMQPDGIQPFQMGLPALDAFPRKAWARLAAREWRSMQADGMIYPPFRGAADLRSEIAAYLQVSRGIACAPSQVFITSGYRQTLDLITRVLLKPADQVWLEDPGYPTTRELLVNAGFSPVYVPVDEDGLVVSAGAKAAPRAKAAVVTPAHQSPLCVTLSLPRRLALLDWATRAGAWIIEDDYDGEYRYVGRPLPALKSLDRDGRVIYAGTFSKVLFPSLRVAYVVVPENEVECFQRASQIYAGGTAGHTQAVITAFIREGHFARHIQKMRKLYGERRDATAAGLSAVLGKIGEIAPQPGGMHLVLKLREPYRDTVLAQRMREHGLYAQGLTGWGSAARGQQALLLNFTNIDSQRTAEVLARRVLALV